MSPIPMLLQDGRLIADTQGRPRADLADDSDPANAAIIRLEWDGQERTWLITAFDDQQGSIVARQARRSNEQPASASSRIPDATGQAEGTPSALAVQGPDIRLAEDADFGAGSASPALDAANRAALADPRARLEAEDNPSTTLRRPSPRNRCFTLAEDRTEKWECYNRPSTGG